MKQSKILGLVLTVLMLGQLISACSSPSKSSIETVKTVGTSSSVPAANNSMGGQNSKPIKYTDSQDRKRRQAVLNKYQAVCTPFYSGDENYPYKLCPDTFYVELHNLVPPKKLGQTIPYSREKNSELVFLGTNVDEAFVMNFRVIGKDEYLEYFSGIGIRLKPGVRESEFIAKWKKYKFGGYENVITLRLNSDEIIDQFHLFQNDPMVDRVSLMPVGRPDEPA